MNDIVNNHALHQFELGIDGHLATAHYETDGEVVTFMHTEVPPQRHRLQVSAGRA